jgi:hypothetical protein
VAQPLPRSFAARQRLEDEAKIARIVAEAEPAPAPGTAGGDRQRLRGLPAVARGVPGASPHTNPEAALMSKEARRRK